MMEFVKANTESLFRTLRELCAIPAPSHFEQERAAYCKAWLERIGAKGVYIDEAQNVILPINCEGSDRITVFVAHTDTVFPDREPMPYVEDGSYIRSPGVGDDTASVSVLLHVAKYFLEQGITPEGGVMFVCNSCEEGLGNLKGTRQLFRDFEGRIAQFVSIDGSRLHALGNRCVGSHRYEVEVRTEGGHSYSAFGNKNAIVELARIVGEIYAIEIPRIGNSRTTYNVGGMQGGTSINTIPQSATMLCEYRSNNVQCMEIMKERFMEIFRQGEKENVQVQVQMVGDRPCGKDIDPARMEKLIAMGKKIGRDVLGRELKMTPVKSSAQHHSTSELLRTL